MRSKSSTKPAFWELSGVEFCLLFDVLVVLTAVRSSNDLAKDQDAFKLHLLVAMGERSRAFLVRRSCLLYFTGSLSSGCQVLAAHGRGAHSQIDPQHD